MLSTANSIDDPTAFVGRHAMLITRLARAFMGERGHLDPRDVAQDVILSLLRKQAGGAFRPERVECPEAYLRVMVRRAVHRLRRDSARAVASIDEWSASLGMQAGGEDVMHRAMDAHKSLLALRRELRPRDALAFSLLVEEGSSVAGAAAALGATPNHVYQMRHRIRASLRARAR